MGSAASGPMLPNGAGQQFERRNGVGYLSALLRRLRPRCGGYRNHQGCLARPEWRATCLGVYRFWRDLGYAIGALLAGIIADWLGMAAAIHSIAALTLFSGLLVLLAMPETLPACNPANKRMNLT